MTQEQLAEKLNVSNRSVSRWENGRNMPDISMFNPLCELLGISVNELVNGERIVDEEIVQKADETIVSTIESSNSRIKTQRKKIIAIIIAFLLIIISMLVAIDKAIYSPCAYHKGDVTEWASGFPNHSAYALALNEDGKPVFKNPEKALRKAKRDCSDAIKVVRKEHHLLPLSKYNYKTYLTWSWQTAANKELEQDGIDTAEQGVDLTKSLIFTKTVIGKHKRQIPMRYLSFIVDKYMITNSNK